MEAGHKENFLRVLLETVPPDTLPFLAAFAGVIAGHVVWTMLVMCGVRLARATDYKFPFLAFLVGPAAAVFGVMLFLVGATGI